MLPKTLQSALALSCYAIVSNEFAMFLNPQMRGSKFTWERFPALMESHCSHGVLLNTEIPEKHVKEAQAFAAKTGAEIALRLVKESGLAEEAATPAPTAFFMVFETFSTNEEAVAWHRMPGTGWATFEEAVTEARRQAEHYLNHDFCDDEERGVQLVETLDAEAQRFCIEVDSTYRGLPIFRVKRVTVGPSAQ